MKRWQYLIALFSMLFVLAACQQEKVEEPGPSEEEVKSPTEQQDQEEVEEADERETKPVLGIEENALHKWDLADGVQVVLVQDAGELEVLEHTSALGLEGERQYSGDVSLYLVTEGGEVGYLSDTISDVTLNLDRAFTEPYTFRDAKMITWAQPEASNLLTTKMWRYADGELEKVLFDGEEEKIWSTTNLKFLKDAYLQTYFYNNNADGPGIGWYYETWQWDEKTKEFTIYDETSYTDAEEYGWESGEYITEIWHEHEEYYILFPEYELTKELLHQIEEGRLIEGGVRLGDSIDEVLANSPAYTQHDYYEGGKYYSFPGPFSYFYDEISREITYVLMGGRALKNDMDSLRSILGEPEYDGYDDYIMTNSASFIVGAKRLRIEYEDAGKVTGLWLNEMME